MKASEMIIQLQKLMDEHGDKHVFLEDWSEEYEMPCEAGQIVYDDFDGLDSFVIDVYRGEK